MLRRKAPENYQNLSEEEKNKKYQFAHNRYRQLFMENEHSEEVKNKKREYAQNQYKCLSEEEKGKKREYAPEQYRNLSEEEKKTKTVNMHLNNIEIFLSKKKKEKCQYGRERYRKQKL